MKTMLKMPFRRRCTRDRRSDGNRQVRAVASARCVPRRAGARAEGTRLGSV